MKKYLIYGLVTVLLVVISIGGTYIYMKSKTSIPATKETPTKNPDEDKTPEEKKDDEENKEKPENKVDSKIWIYEANYKPNDDTKEYYTSRSNLTYYLQDLRVPYINIDSTNAGSINKVIKTIYNEALSVYKRGLKDRTSFATIDYEYSTTDKIGSVLITYKSGGTSTVHPIYYTYNFNLETGKLLSYEETYRNGGSYDGYKSTTINEQVKNAITKYLTEKLRDYNEECTEEPCLGISYFPEGTNLNTFIENSYNNYLNSIKNNKIQYYLNEKELYVVVTLSMPFDTGSFDTILKIEEQ